MEQEYLNTEFHIEFELFFSDLSAIGGPEKWQQMSAAEFADKAVFKSVSKQRFLMKRLPQGISEYVSVVFDEQYFSSMQCLVQATLLDFRFRMRTVKSVQEDFSQRGMTVVKDEGGTAARGSSKKQQR